MQKLKGLWIPAKILLNKDLSDKEKIILSMILYLSEEKGSCFASNKYIANIVNVTPERVSKIISSLKDKGYISVKLKYKTDSKEIEERQIYQRERDIILEDNENLHNEVEQIKKEYKEKEFNIEWKYKSKIKDLEKENSHLHKIIDKFYDTIDKFIHWICEKFDMGAEDSLIRDFQKETDTLLDAEKQIEHEAIEKEWDLER